ncbi:S66 family peptidase [Vagococcus vulneris]|uniref:Carboxypeptidase n=1 Tax=Vagococcus vulneris TaxID=1977869 RepID=A0A429ZV88_9ENTE|nr:S66 peptidase family protein [Vagococcus vulneris]RST97651.1 carboxypeptidase [Vagococcus vulneris]
MLKPKRLKKGDKVAIVSLSKGLLGEDFIKHNLEIGTRRLQEFGLEPVCMRNTLKGIAYLKEHPEKRADDLIQAFKDESIKGIICAIGGNDTYRTIPYLMGNKDFSEAVRTNPKLFTGFSDTTVNHFMFHRLGLVTYYGMSLIPDIGEISEKMLPYTEKYFKYYLDASETLKSIYPSNVWYEERKDFSAKSIGKNRISHVDNKGYELLQGQPVFEGELLGGCIDSIYNMLAFDTHKDEPEIIKKYRIFPSLEEWKGKIIFLETSEIKENPKIIRKMLLKLKQMGIFEVVNGIIFGKPQDEVFYEEYKQILTEVVGNKEVSIIYNVNFGHATPRCVLPIGVKARVDALNQEIIFLEDVFEY